MSIPRNENRSVRIKQIRSARFGPEIVIAVSPDDRDGLTKEVHRGTIARQQLRNLLTGARVEQIGRPGIAPVVAIGVGANNGRRTTDRYGIAKTVERGAICGEQLFERITDARMDGTGQQYAGK